MEHGHDCNGLDLQYTQYHHNTSIDSWQTSGPNLGIPQLNISSQPFLPATSLSDALIQHDETQHHRDAVCNYLLVPKDLWAALFQTPSVSPAQKVLSDYLIHIYGPLPPGLWHCLLCLRGNLQFDQLQDDLVERVSALPASRLHSRSGSSTSRLERGSPEMSRNLGSFHPTPGHSPSDSSPWPMVDPTIQTQPGTPMPLSIVRSRTNSKSPYSKDNRKGRAPPGQSFYCPVLECTHSPFRNTGNYLIHLDRFHPDYPKHDPSEALRCDQALSGPDAEGTMSSTTLAIAEDTFESSVAPDEGLSFGRFQETLQWPNSRTP
ncbi:uncharacterized protein PV06_01933 [Exophiala oligosperma]|uniref:Uncharacterized protein n=1 Tax=Exophiala oligosperma TaxID=215243 RepID=A0A0D2C8T9_9EURO|nr:uncharacterized protein PV06_01933 [Exophiala oligosperma]KIW46252.1 hypothetical protein PV06_01933 [Exophiala oligosperma]